MSPPQHPKSTPPSTPGLQRAGRCPDGIRVDKKLLQFFYFFPVFYWSYLHNSSARWSLSLSRGLLRWQAESHRSQVDNFGFKTQK